MALAQWLARLAPFLPLRPFRSLITTRAGLVLLFGPLTDSQQRLLTEIFTAITSDLLRAGMRLATSHCPASPVLCPAHAIHGGNNRPLRPPLSGCRLVPDAGHILALTRPREVMVFLRETPCR